jgi:hypothetical protein
MTVERVLGALVGGLVLWAVAYKRPKVGTQIQSLFDCFHDVIKLDENDERRKLRAKREILLETLKNRLAAESLTFEPILQGSYAMRTGVVPKDGNYDIDVGLVFNCSPKRFPDPVKLKSLVRDALAEGNRTVNIRRSCVTVTYLRRGEPEYHVDLAVYVKQPNGSLLLGRGREFSGTEQREWVRAAPNELTQYVCARFDGEEQAQFRRCIRYLKRWRDENFTKGAPPSIALTLAAALWFEPRRADDGTYVDLEALHFLVKKMCSNFEIGWSVKRLIVRHPAPVRADLMSGLTDAQMVTFAERLKNLQQALENCFGDVGVTEAAPILAAQFGSDFPLPSLALIKAESQGTGPTRI